ncbi:hypothetical protein NC652_015586 [Populus alba x Populus x berolinensis]|nr:hypothetical protein NC652_015586 [Populus alba x Populus x berolinensis]
MSSILLLFLRIGIHFKTIPETILFYVSIFISLTNHILLSFVLVPSVSRVALTKRSIILLVLCFQSWTKFSALTAFFCHVLFVAILLQRFCFASFVDSQFSFITIMLKRMTCGGNWLIFLRTLSGGPGAYDHGGREHNSNCLDCH